MDEAAARHDPDGAIPLPNDPGAQADPTPTMVPLTHDARYRPPPSHHGRHLMSHDAIPSHRDPVSGAARRVLVIGGTSGIGAETAYRFARSGDHVIAAGLDVEHVPERLASLVRVVEADVREHADVEALIGGLDTLDVLVNAAGILRRDEEYELDVFTDVVAVNLVGTMSACVTARDLLASSNGAIVNVASMLSYFGGPRVPGYTASKGGIVQLTKSLAVAWAAEGIRVNAVAPGWIRTDLTHELQHDYAAAQKILDRTPLGRWGEASDVAGVVYFLASADAAFVTGAVVPVDGGYLAT